MDEALYEAETDVDRLLRSARETIDSAQLSAIEHFQLGLLLTYTTFKAGAAQLILKAAHEPGKCVEDNLRSVNRAFQTLAQKCKPNETPCPISPRIPSNSMAVLPNDHEVPVEADAALRERENGRCCVSGLDSGLQATYIVPPQIVDDPDLLPGGALRPHLDAVLSPETSNELFLLLKCYSQENQLKNLWLMSQPWNVRKSHYGDSSVTGLYDEKFYAQPSSSDETRLPLPEGFLLDVQKAFASIRRLQSFEEQVQNGLPKVPEGKIGVSFLRALAIILPAFLLSAIYNLTVKAVAPSKRNWVARVKFLPFGLCLKYGGSVSKNEANALLLVEKHTTIPAPQLIDFTRDKHGTGFLLMTTVPGIPAEKVYYLMTYEEREQLAKDLGKCVSQYRRIKNCHRSLICDTTGGPITDNRIGHIPYGPYATKTAFLDDLTEGLEELRRERPLSLLYEKEHEICFTHSDLHLANLLLDGGRLSGIVDWENAGFKPEYWDYTRAVWVNMSSKRYAHQLRLAFDKDYQDELEAERLLWRLKPEKGTASAATEIPGTNDLPKYGVPCLISRMATQRLRISTSPLAWAIVNELHQSRYSHHIHLSSNRSPYNSAAGCSMHLEPLLPGSTFWHTTAPITSTLAQEPDIQAATNPRRSLASTTAIPWAHSMHEPSAWAAIKFAVAHPEAAALAADPRPVSRVTKRQPRPNPRSGCDKLMGSTDQTSDGGSYASLSFLSPPSYAAKRLACLVTMHPLASARSS
ncbi:predicted protein [Uncinocarpus reesii 1704]|uniref:Aminoglycoside phosphotransferase domain-containing protein n=1 Tax=Uncinocarpus reesii (strain UAMH 1704) TaxID=336963 RepID=C4JG24_UNCRE|nr:uncharacterized protein UREG_01104 [Uncinocarpus reesii 1704]EEP76255.1 predicted protein [Uncinocarpus reesii 1704]